MKPITRSIIQSMRAVAATKTTSAKPARHNIKHISILNDCDPLPAEKRSLGRKIAALRKSKLLKNDDPMFGSDRAGVALPRDLRKCGQLSQPHVHVRVLQASADRVGTKLPQTEMVVCCSSRTYTATRSGRNPARRNDEASNRRLHVAERPPGKGNRVRLIKRGWMKSKPWHFMHAAVERRTHRRRRSKLSGNCPGYLQPLQIWQIVLRLNQPHWSGRRDSNPRPPAPQVGFLRITTI